MPGFRYILILLGLSFLLLPLTAQDQQVYIIKVPKELTRCQQRLFRQDSTKLDLRLNQINQEVDRFLDKCGKVGSNHPKVEIQRCTDRLGKINAMKEDFFNDISDYEIRIVNELDLLKEPLPDVNIVIKRLNQLWIGEIDQERKEKDIISCTQGELYVNGEYYSKTLELIFDNARKDSSSIPVGKYNAKALWSKKKKRWVIQLPVINPLVYYQDEDENWKMKRVERDGLQIHAGDYTVIPDSTLKGCILVGNDDIGCRFTDSKKTFNNLLEDYFGCADDPDKRVKVTVTIQLVPGYKNREE